MLLVGEGGRETVVLTESAVVALGAEQTVHYYHGRFGCVFVCVGGVMAGVG